MARTTAVQKQETRKRIVAAAARAFRAEGADAGIADIMDRLGLTNGGFYRHFESKNDLFVESVRLALDDMAERLARAAEAAPPAQRRTAIISTYLSLEHLAHPEAWCALVALGGDLGRSSRAVLKRLEPTMLAYVDRLRPFMTGDSPEQQQGNAIVLLAAMTGAMIMVRTLADKQAREQMLAMLREQYITMFG